MEDNSKTIDLDGIMYNEDGSFKPFLWHHFNLNGEIAYHRNTYMEAEKEYFSQLLVDEKVRNYLINLLYNNKPDDLYEEAMKIQEKLENGNLESLQEKMQMLSMTPEEREQYHYEKLEYAEGIMCLLFAAIRDKGKILNELQCLEERFSKVENSIRGLK